MGSQARRRYAQRTTVPEERSQAQIQRALKRFGAKGFVVGLDEQWAGVKFRVDDAIVRLAAPLPAREEFERTASGRPRAVRDIDRRWREADVPGVMLSP